MSDITQVAFGNTCGHSENGRFVVSSRLLVS